MNKGQQTKKTILEAAMLLLGRDGPAGFSASALAQAAGVSKATLFHHFATLDLIPLAAFEQLWSAALSRDRASGASLREYLAALGHEVIAAAREQRDFLNAYFVFAMQAIFNPPLRERLLASAQTMHAQIVEALAGALPPAEVEPTARLIGLALDGLGLHLLVLGGEDGLARAWARLTDLIAPPDHQTQQ